MTNKNFKDAVWKPVREKHNNDEYETFTLVRIEGWRRLAFASNHSGIWCLSPDPAYINSMSNRKITHWLAVPKVPKD